MRETKWFTGATLNFAQNLLSRRDDHLALIYVDENGVFQEQVLLARGYNIFKIEIEDTFHYKKHQFIELIYEPKKGL